jgi:hypothetical protein
VFEHVVASQRAALSLVLRGLAPGLSERERREAYYLSSRLTSHLTHNAPMQELLWGRYTAFLATANAAMPLTIVIDDLTQLDAPSFAVLLQLMRSHAAAAPDVVAGYDAALPERVHLDARGILWDVNWAHLKHRLGALAYLPTYSGRIPAESGAPCSCPIERDQWDLCCEQEAKQLLARPTRIEIPSNARRIAMAIRHAFEVFAFNTSLRLAVDALDQGVPFSDEDRASVLGVAGISAHNRQFYAQGNQRLAAYLRDTYCEALTLERDPERRISLYYRLAVTYCRRLGDLANARKSVAAGLAALARSDLAAADHQLQASWLRNIEAFVHIRDGELVAAFRSCDLAFDVLRDVESADPTFAAEIELTKLVVSENALTLASISGNEPVRDRWLARSREGVATWPSLRVVNLFEQQRTHIDRLEIAQARELGAQALEMLRSTSSFLLEYFVLVTLSDLSFRLADYERAAEYGDLARTLGIEIGDFHGTLLALELRAAETALARGDDEAAEQILQALLAEGRPSLDLQAEVLGRLACVHAGRGSSERANDLLTEAIERTVESGALDLALAASCHAGQVAEHLGLREDASAAYANCFELLDVQDGEVRASTPFRELQRLKAVVGQKRLGTPAQAQLAMCVQRLPRLLAQEREAWPLARELVEPAWPAGSLPPEVEPVLRVVMQALAMPPHAAIAAQDRA